MVFYIHSGVLARLLVVTAFRGSIECGCGRLISSFMIVYPHYFTNLICGDADARNFPNPAILAFSPAASFFPLPTSPLRG